MVKVTNRWSTKNNKRVATTRIVTWRKFRLFRHADEQSTSLSTKNRLFRRYRPRERQVHLSYRSRPTDCAIYQRQIPSISRTIYLRIPLYVPLSTLTSAPISSHIALLYSIPKTLQHSPYFIVRTGSKFAAPRCTSLKPIVHVPNPD